MTVIEIILRVLLALAIGALIGWERELVNRPAGLRTHMLVAIGASIIMVIGEASMFRYIDLAAVDPTRLGAQVISGVGFLGAGTILREGVNVRGLTTAASLWAVACLGLAAGGGYYLAAGTGTVAIMLTLTIFDYLEKRLIKSRLTGYKLKIDCVNLPDVISTLNKIVEKHNTMLEAIRIESAGNADTGEHRIEAKVLFKKSKKERGYNDIATEIAMCDGVIKMNIEEYQPT